MWRPGASSRAAKPLRIAMARLNATSCTAIITLLRVWIRSRRMRKFVSTSTPTDFYSFLFRESEASRTLTRMAGTHDRRQFLQALATLASTAVIPGADLASAASSASAPRWPKLTGSPVLDSLHPVIEHSRDVRATVTRPQLERRFAGNIEMPMLDEKMQVWRQVGSVLARKYDGRFHNFVKSCPPRLYDNGAGLIDRMVKEFPRFNDVSQYDGETVKLYKLPQLGIWLVYSALRKSGQFRLEDMDKMTAFADYIVPVALRLLGITSYSAELERAINAYQMIPRDSRWEVEIRAHCIYATALLTEEINHIRPKNQQIIIPQIDARLWTHYHTTSWPHHLTKTIMY